MIKLEKVSKSYKPPFKALNDISLVIEDGEFVFITGESGSGKSTLFKLLIKETDLTSGNIIVNGIVVNNLKKKFVAKYRRGLGVVFQDFRLLNNLTVFENIAFAQRVIGVPNHKIYNNVVDMLKLTNLVKYANRYPLELSGGEQQRVAIARAVINLKNPEHVGKYNGIILADEPTGNLDKQNAVQIMRLLDDINKHGVTVVVITHDREIVKKMHKRVIEIERGRLIKDQKMASTQALYEGLTIDEEKTAKNSIQNTTTKKFTSNNTVTYSEISAGIDKFAESNPVEDARKHARQIQAEREREKAEIKKVELESDDFIEDVEDFDDTAIIQRKRGVDGLEVKSLPSSTKNTNNDDFALEYALEINKFSKSEKSLREAKRRKREGKS